MSATAASPSIKGVFAGSGKEGMQMPEVCDAVLRLVGKPPGSTRVLYIGTATYDLEKFMLGQTQSFASAGCLIDSLKCTSTGDCTWEEMMEKVATADVLVVSGGNTLHAVERWKSIGLQDLLTAAMQRGCVLTGGSAGAICWFDGGHSDSGDPDTYRTPFLAGDISAQIGQAPEAGEEKTWRYMRVSGLGFLPGIVCPHADKVQSNGLLRILDFDDMLLRHRGERGICIDHFAALIVDGEDYSVLSVADKPGSLAPDGSRVTDQSGRPGLWIKDVQEDGSIHTSPVPPEGKIASLLQTAEGGVEEDPAVLTCIAENPFDAAI